MTRAAVPTRRSAGLHLRRRLLDMRDFLRSAAGLWRKHGSLGVWNEVRARTIYRLYRRRRLLVLEQDLATRVETPALPGVEIRIFSGPDWSPLGQIVSERKVRLFQQRAAAGRICFVAWREGCAIGYSWLSTQVHRSLELFPLVLPQGTAYGWDLYVTPAERNRGVASALVSARSRLAGELGFRKVWRVVSHDNVRSIRTFEKTSGGRGRVVGEMVTVTVLKRMRARPFRGDLPAAAHAASDPPGTVSGSS